MTLDHPGGRPAALPADLLDMARFYRLRSTPQRPREPDQPDPVPAQLFAALTAAHSDLSAAPDGQGALVVAWQRLPGETSVQVLFGGRPTFTPAHDAVRMGEVVPVLYPPGSLAELVDTSDVLDTWAKVPAWIRCAGRPDALWTPTDIPERPRLLRGGFDDYIAHLGEGFVWLVLAQPLTAADLAAELETLRNSIPRLRRQENNAASQVDLLRAEGRYRELSRARASGLWRVQVVVGGDSPAAARRAAALLCSASDLDDQPYTLTPDVHAASFPEALSTAIAPDPVGTMAPFTATSELLAALARPPQRELPGIRLIERVAFDLTPESSGPLHLGDVLDDADQPVGRFSVGTDTLNRHTFVAGATGAGKSQTVRHLLEQLHQVGVPWLVIEPAKAEYAGMAGRIGEENLVVLHPGDPDAVPYGLNPLQPEPGFPLQTHVDLVRALFLAAFEAAEPFPQVLSQALDRCYRDLGWDPVTSSSQLPGITPRYPRLGDLHRTALDVVRGIGYGREVSDNVRGFIDVRIRSLQLGTPGRFFDGRYPLDIGDLMRRNAVLEIEDLGEDSDKAFLIGALLIRIVEHLRVQHSQMPGSGLRHVTVVEEAHRLLRHAEPGSPAARAVELFTALLAEIRAYGEGIVVAEQIPDKIVPDVIKNTALKIVHRLPGQDDREVVGATMNLDEAQSRHVVSLPPGRAAVFADGMDRPIRISVPYGEAREAKSRCRTQAIAVDRTKAGGDGEPVMITRQLAAAEQLASDPELVVWIELLTVAHVAGFPPPRPRRAWCASLLGRASDDVVRGAVVHAVKAAVDARYRGLAGFYQPEDLAEHLTQAALGDLLHDMSGCDRAEVEWQAGPCRWIDVHRALKDLPGAGQHPDTPLWAARGLRLDGQGPAAQRAQLRIVLLRIGHDNKVIVGHGAYHRAIEKLSGATEERQRVSEATQFLRLDSLWPLRVLPQPDTASGGR